MSMASRRRARRQRDIDSTIRPSVETTSDNAPPLSDSNNVSNKCRESNSTSYEPDKTEDAPKRRGLMTPEPKPYDPETYGAWGRKHFGEEWYERRNARLREGKTVVLVSGVQMIIQQPYDPDTYDPDRRVPWTPEPEPYDPETYTAWGRKHFGDDWYEQRNTMLRERNFYMKTDPVYEERQRALRILEHRVERRPFEPQSGVLSEDWKRLWARLWKKFPSAESDCNAASPMPLHDSDSDLSGYDTYAPTPEPRELTPIPNDSWERLEFDRRRFHWDEEEYQFERIFLKEAIIDGRRRKHEDEEGDRRREEELEEIRKVRYLPGTLVKSGEYEDRMRKFNLRAKGLTQEQIDAKERDPMQYERQERANDLRGNGWTQEQIDAADRADIAFGKWKQENPPPKGSGFFGLLRVPTTQEERDAIDIWNQKERAAKLRIYGELPPRGSGAFGLFTQKEESAFDTWRRNIHARVSSQQEQELMTDATAPASATQKASQPRVLRTRQTKDVSRKTRGSRITKNAAQNQGITRSHTESRPSAPTLTDAHAPTRDRQSKRFKRAPAARDELADSILSAQRHPRRRKIYEEKRECRRLHGLPPEFGLLPERRRAPPLFQRSSNSRKRSNSGPHHDGLPKRLTLVRGAKPQGISKSGREGTNRPKRSKKQSEG